LDVLPRCLGVLRSRRGGLAGWRTAADERADDHRNRGRTGHARPDGAASTPAHHGGTTAPHVCFDDVGRGLGLARAAHAVQQLLDISHLIPLGGHRSLSIAARSPNAERN
jgi:hypothetical protein